MGGTEYKMSQLVNLKKSYFVAGVIHALRQNLTIENMFATSCVHQIIVAVDFFFLALSFPSLAD